MNETQSVGIERIRPQATLAVALSLLDVRIRLLAGLRSTLRQLDVERPDAPLHAAEAERLAHRVDRILDRLRVRGGGRQLTRSLTLFRLLRRRGVPLEFHLGVRDGDDALHGRCWLSHHDRPLFEEDDPGTRVRSVYRYCSRSDRQFHIPIEVVDRLGEELLASWRSLVWRPTA